MNDKGAHEIFKNRKDPTNIQAHSDFIYFYISENLFQMIIDILRALPNVHHRKIKFLYII